MPWYQMPAIYQKEVLCAMHSAQTGAVLTMGPLGDLDFEMTTSVRDVLIFDCLRSFRLKVKN